jgi:ADP-ribosylarginine hydrolase
MKSMNPKEKNSKEKNSKEKNRINEKINASMILSSYLDTLGYFNGTWEFNYGIPIKTLQDAILVNYEIVHKYHSMGGLSIDVSKWYASDDTIMMIATMKACLKGGKIEHFIKCYLDILPQLEEKKRASGITTLNSLRLLDKSHDINKIIYSSTMGGNGAAMRTHYIGIHFTDIEKIIKVSIESSRLTHNYPLGFLGGMTTALFTRYALDDIEPWKWCDLLIELNKNSTIDNIVKKMTCYKQYIKDKDEFWNIWYRYKEYRLSKFELKGKEFMYGNERFKELIDVIYDVKDYTKVKFDRLGGCGGSATLIAYDSILMSIIHTKDGEMQLDLKDKSSYYYNWGSLIFHSSLHFGDNDTIGAIAGCWFGALRGFDNIDMDRILKQLEFKKEYKKYLIL